MKVERTPVGLRPLGCRREDGRGGWSPRVLEWTYEESWGLRGPQKASQGTVVDEFGLNPPRVPGEGGRWQGEGGRVGVETG